MTLRDALFVTKGTRSVFHRPDGERYRWNDEGNDIDYEGVPGDWSHLYEQFSADDIMADDWSVEQENKCPPS